MIPWTLYIAPAGKQDASLRHWMHRGRQPGASHWPHGYNVRQYCSRDTPFKFRKIYHWEHKPSGWQEPLPSLCVYTGVTNAHLAILFLVGQDLDVLCAFIAHWQLIPCILSFLPTTPFSTSFVLIWLNINSLILPLNQQVHVLTEIQLEIAPLLVMIAGLEHLVLKLILLPPPTALLPLSLPKKSRSLFVSKDHFVCCST